MDFPFFFPDVTSSIFQRSLFFWLDTNTGNTDVGTGLSDRIRNLRQLFPDSFRTETYTSDTCQYVQLHPANNSNSNQHRSLYGHPYLAKNSGRLNGLCWCLHCESQQNCSLTCRRDIYNAESPASYYTGDSTYTTESQLFKS